MRLSKRAYLAISLSVLALGAARSAGADPVKLRIAFIVPAVDGPLAQLGKPGIAQHEGKSYALEFVHFAGTPPMMMAMAANEVDIASVAFSSFPVAVKDNKLEDLRIVADVLQDGVENHDSTEYMVLNDGPVKKIEDLKGKVVTSNAAGSAVDMPLRVMLRKHGLEDRRDYNLIESPFSTMKAELLERKVDLITVVPPFKHDSALSAAAHALFVQKDAMGRSQALAMVARRGFLQRNRAAVVDFLEDNLRELHWYFDPAHHDEAIKSVADYTRTPAALWSSWLFTEGDFYRDPAGRPDLDAMQRNIATLFDLGFLPDGLDPKKYADLSLVEEAGKRLR